MCAICVQALKMDLPIDDRSSRFTSGDMPDDLWWREFSGLSTPGGDSVRYGIGIMVTVCGTCRLGGLRPGRGPRTKRGYRGAEDR
ncbi:hypothetical protein CRV15_00400 [Streptomyces clavuligerus]|uniref:Uncharacterized protein n=1 Tax=Streptomyces clavuligerus TaxID=1901 RepID=B5GZF0_STRCL|nr:hypothetical protein D1794_00400 [Streptomyces clavuligerus]EDY51696.1 hypothetical protein SSCG_04724 [Streptomyces clavuligerus]EFG10710.1 Hypothetical protein SCLAV_5643 [Streptomyces clavuligerus]QCS04180.1 hypothetical protein CRV15_00400 [Streptomyces clavuligerus]QPJ96432.1 hypothetical protein GE265_27470 [Streptomyces clavuligerus]